MEITRNDAAVLAFESRGRVAAAHGLYENDLRLSLPGAEGPLTAALEVRYQPDTALDNFTLKASLPEAGHQLAVAGTLHAEGQALEADLYDIRLNGGASLSLAFSCRPAAGFALAEGDPVMLLELGEDELNALLFRLALSGGLALDLLR